MNQEVIDFLEQNLKEAHEIFNGIIREMQDNNISYPYAIILEKEKESYNIVIDYLTKMTYELHEYNTLKEANSEIFDSEYKIYLKYVTLYILSIVLIRLFHEVFDTDKFNEYWHYIIGLFLGGTFMRLLNKDITDNYTNTKEKRDLISNLTTLKEKYKENHDDAVSEIDYIFALNDNLWDELDNGKKLVKNK